MNNKQDFLKKPSGIIVNTNKHDYKRARNRNFTRREQEKIIGENGKVAVLENEINELKLLVKQLMENK